MRYMEYPFLLLVLSSHTAFCEGDETANTVVDVDFAKFARTLNLKPNTQTMQLPEEARKLDGRLIRIHGFMYPQNRKSEISVFQLNRNPVTAARNSSRKYLLFQVKIRKGTTVTYTQETVVVQGKLHIKKPSSDDEHGFQFTIDHATVSELPIKVLRDLKPNHKGPAWTVAFSPNGKLLASGSWAPAPTIKLWEVATGKELASLSGHEWNINCVAISPDGKTLASAAEDDTVRLWDIATRKEKLSLHVEEELFASVAFSPDGKTLATATNDGDIALRDAATGREYAHLKATRRYGIYSIAFSPDGKTLAVGQINLAVVLWDVATRTEKAILKGHEDKVRSVAFSPDGKTLASVSWDADVKLWDVDSGKELRTLDGKVGSLFSVAFSPDGNQVAAGGDYGYITLWDVATGRKKATLRHGGLTIFSLDFSPDGKSLASGAGTYGRAGPGRVRLWNLADMPKEVMDMKDRR